MQNRDNFTDVISKAATTPKQTPQSSAPKTVKAPNGTQVELTQPKGEDRNKPKK